VAQQQATQLYNTFVKGLITEANPLTYPENASIDELNTVLFRKGNRKRRLGIDTQDFSGLSFSTFNFGDRQANEFVWESPGDANNKAFLCVQSGEWVFFLDLANNPIASGLRTFQINMSLFLAPGRTVQELRTLPMSMASGKGFLFICSEVTEPVIVEYKNDVFTANTVTIQIRDFEGVDDGLAPEQEPVTLSAAHEYNLHNQGWGQGSGKTRSYFDPFKGTNVTYTVPSSSVAPISEYFSSLAKYPGNNRQWWYSRAQQSDSGPPAVAIGDFLPDVLDKLPAGNARAPRGHFILNAFNKDRSLASGIFGLTPEITPTRPNSVAFYAGRAWYAEGSTVYFSQFLTDRFRAGMCYQEADPTSEEISDLIATDGGEIPIPEASKIVGLKVHNDGLMVFALNGIWFVGGGRDNGFKATDFQVRKVSPVGTPDARSFVATKDGLYWWSDEGIVMMKQDTGAFGAIPGQFSSENISLLTVQTLINNITGKAKAQVKGVFDYRNNKIYWLYNDSDNLVDRVYYNKVLIFDTLMQAFTPWEFASSDVEIYPKVCGAFVLPTLIETLGQLTYDGDERKGPVRYICNKNGLFYFGEVGNKAFVDWETLNGGLNYDSYSECGYVILDDAARKKQAPTIVVVAEVTDKNWVPQPDGNFNSDCPSSVFMQVKWDWANSSKANKWSQPTQCYRFTRFMSVDPLSTEFDSGHFVTVTRHRIRGIGRSLSFRFSCSEPGKDFNILGWQPRYLANVQV
jgi:hypothetical protein